MEKAIEAQEEYVRSYPREARGPGNLGNLYAITGQFEKAVTLTSEAQRLNPNTAIWPGNLAEALLALNRFDEAREVCQRALAQKLDSTSIRERLYSAAFVTGDSQALQEQPWASGRPDEYRAVNWQTQSASYGGEWRKSEEHLRRATELALRAEAREVVASYTAEHAFARRVLGHSAWAVSLAESAKVEHNRTVLTSGAMALALVGEATSSQSLFRSLNRNTRKTRGEPTLDPEIKAALNC